MRIEAYFKKNQEIYVVKHSDFPPKELASNNSLPLTIAPYFTLTTLPNDSTESLIPG